MAIVLQLPSVKRIKKERPTECPYCEGETFQRWGSVKKQVKDTKVRSVKVYRNGVEAVGGPFGTIRKG